MPDLHDVIKARFNFVRKDLNEAFAHVSDAMLDWAPSAGMPTVRDLLFEIAGTEVQILDYIREGKRTSLKEVTAGWEGFQTVESIRRMLDAVRGETFAFIDSLSEAELEASFHFPEAWFESLGLPEVPLREGFSSLAAHEWYHVGQLVSYLWIVGDDPNTW